MLRVLDESLEAFLRAEVPLRPDEIDVAFDAPDGEWSGGLTRPTVNLFLWDIRQSPDESRSGSELVDGPDGRVWKEPAARMMFRYLCTVWTNDVRDEHDLLGEMLLALLPTRVMPDAYLMGSLAEVRPPPGLKTAKATAKDFTELWSALEGKLRAGLDLTVTATVDAAVMRKAGPDVAAVELHAGDLDARGVARRIDSRRLVGGQVGSTRARAGARSRRRIAVVDENGRFVVPAEPGEDVVIETDPPTRLTVPRQGLVTLEEFEVTPPAVVDEPTPAPEEPGTEDRP